MQRGEKSWLLLIPLAYKSDTESKLESALISQVENLYLELRTSVYISKWQYPEGPHGGDFASKGVYGLVPWDSAAPSYAFL